MPAVAGRRLRLRRADPRDRGLRLRLRQRLHRRPGAARDPADLREHRDVGERATAARPSHRPRGRRCTTPARSPAWPSATRSSASCTPWRTPSAPRSTWSHGRTNATLLPHVIRYNGTVPTKLTSWPKYEHYVAPERFQQIAQTLGLPAGTPEEGVESYARRRREPARRGRHRAVVPGAGRRRAGVPRPRSTSWRWAPTRPVRAGQPADADAGRHEGSDGRRLLRHLDRRRQDADGRQAARRRRRPRVACDSSSSRSERPAVRLHRQQHCPAETRP